MVSQLSIGIQVSAFMLMFAGCGANKPLMRSAKRSSQKLSQPGSFDMAGAANQKTAAQQAVSIDSSSILQNLKDDKKETSSQDGFVMTNDVVGSCVLTDDNLCVTSRNYGVGYNSGDKCTITTPSDGTIKREGFETERSFDKMQYLDSTPAYSIAYSGTWDVAASTRFPDEIQLSNVKAPLVIYWTSDSSVRKSGWKLCWEAPTATPTMSGTFSSWGAETNYYSDIRAGNRHQTHEHSLGSVQIPSGKPSTGVGFRWKFKYVTGYCGTKNSGDDVQLELKAGGQSVADYTIDIQTADFPYDANCAGCPTCYSTPDTEVIGTIPFDVGSSIDFKFKAVMGSRNIHVYTTKLEIGTTS